MFNEDAKTRQEIRRLQKKMKKSPILFARLGECYIKLGDWANAEKVLIRGVENHPDYTTGHLLLGEGFLYSGFTSDAEDHAQRGLELDPTHLGLLSLLEKIKKQTDDESGLKEVRKNIKKLDPLLKRIKVEHGDADEAMEEPYVE